MVYHSKATTTDKAYLKLNNKFTEYITTEDKLQGALVGMEVKEATTGNTILEHMSHTRLRPASNMKIFTSIAALSVLGEDYTFSTDLLIDGSVKDGQLHSTLYLKGKGDPTLLTSDLKIFAKQIKEGGINVIKGDIVGDDTWYDDIRLSNDMIWSDEHFYYGSQVSALTVSPNADFDTGSIIVEVTSTEIDEKPAVKILPNTSYVDIENRAETSLAGSEDDLIIYREHGTNKIIIEGFMPVSLPPVREWIAVWEPTYYVLALFKEALQQEGVSWTGKLRRAAAPESAQLLYSHSSEPLSKIIIPFMKLSNNGLGEMLVKEMGKFMCNEGSWEYGLDVLLNQLKTCGVNTDTLIIRDGSGISHATLIPAHEIIEALCHIQNEPWFPVFLNSLPEAGNNERMVGGTLSERLEKYEVKAKTGTIYSVSTLSGYLIGRENKKLIFSLLLNNLLDEEDGPGILDHIIKIIAEHA